MGEKTANPGHFAIPTAPAAGTSCTSGAANVFTTTYVQLIASTGAAIYITGIFVESATALGGTYDVVQLATGAAASEVIVGQYLIALSTGTTIATGYRPIYPPIPVANATRIACKTADSAGGKATLITLECINQSNVVDDGVAVGTVTTVTNQLTAAAIATGVWQDTTAGDFTTASSVGKSVMNGVSLGTGLTVASVSGAVGSVTGAVGSVTGAVGSVTGAVGSVTAAVVLPAIPANWITAAGINAAAMNGKGDWMVSYTQPTGFLAATFPSGTVANTTNITAGTITTATNLTNAPTAGDFTATMKTSLNAATPASVVGAVGSVTGNVGGNVVGSVASVTAGVTLAASQHVIVDSGTITTLTNLPAIPAAWLTATGIAASALNGKGDWNAGKTGYSLTQTFPANFSAQVISAGGVADANIKSVAGTTVNGSGTSGSPWGP